MFNQVKHYERLPGKTVQKWSQYLNESSCLAPLCDGRLFNPSVAIRKMNEHFCLLLWLDNTSYRLGLFEHNSPLLSIISLFPSFSLFRFRNGNQHNINTTHNIKDIIQSHLSLPDWINSTGSSGPWWPIRPGSLTATKGWSPPYTDRGGLWVCHCC